MTTLRLTDLSTVPHSIICVTIDGDPGDGNATTVADMLKSTVRVERLPAAELIRQAGTVDALPAKPRRKPRPATNKDGTPRAKPGRKPRAENGTTVAPQAAA